MRVLIFQAAASTLAIAAMTRFGDEVRAQGHSVGLRQLQSFRREKEPADRILIALTPQEAARYKNLGTELVQTFKDTDLIIPVELPDETDEDFNEKLENFDFSDAIGELDENKTGYMSMDRLKAEAIERGLEVRADSTRDELEHSLGLDIHPAAQAFDRETDRKTMARGFPVDRTGFRTSDILPTANGIDLDRLNDEQLQGVAAALDVDVRRGAKRADIIDSITETFAKNVQAPAEGFPKSQAKQPSDNPQPKDGKGGFEQPDLSDLEGKSAKQLQKIAEDEGVDVGRSTSVDGLTEKISQARVEKAKAESKEAEDA